METYFAMNKEIVRLLRISDEVDKQYAALRIEELERYSEECQKVKNVLLEALEEVMGELDVEGLPCPLCGRDLTIGHRHNCIWHVVASAIKKARGEE